MTKLNLKIRSFFAQLLACGFVLSFLLVPVDHGATLATQDRVVWTPSMHASYIESRKKAITYYLSAKYKKQADEVRRYVDLAWLEARKHRDVEPELILAVIQKESSLKPHASNKYGAKGLMQVVPRWHPEKLAKSESLLDPKVNIRVGSQILQEYVAQKGRLDVALVKYSGNAKGYAEFVLREAQVLKAIS